MNRCAEHNDPIYMRIHMYPTYPKVNNGYIYAGKTLCVRILVIAHVRSAPVSWVPHGISRAIILLPSRSLGRCPLKQSSLRSLRVQSSRFRVPGCRRPPASRVAAMVASSVVGHHRYHQRVVSAASPPGFRAAAIVSLALGPLHGSTMGEETGHVSFRDDRIRMYPLYPQVNNEYACISSQSVMYCQYARIHLGALVSGVFFGGVLWVQTALPAREVGHLPCGWSASPVEPASQAMVPEARRPSARCRAEGAISGVRGRDVRDRDMAAALVTRHASSSTP